MKNSRVSIVNQLGMVIRSKRRSTNMSQEQLAERANLHRNYIGSVERGERNITVVNLVILAEALECKASDLLRESEEIEGKKANE